MIGVYVIHLETPLAHARHYIGSSVDIANRISEHRRGHGSPLLRAATEAGINWYVVNMLVTDNEHEARRLEKKIKGIQHNKRYCPICNGG